MSRTGPGRKSRQTAHPFRWRRLLQVWHRWFGILGAVWILALSATGAVIVFYSELEGLLNPHLYYTELSGEPLTPGQILDAAERQIPGAYLRYMNLPDAPDSGQTVAAFMAPRINAPEPPPGGLQVFIDPFSGEVLGQRVFGAAGLDRLHLMPFIYQLHIDLLAGGAMVWFLGLVTFLWLIDQVLSTVYTARIVKSARQFFLPSADRKTHRQMFDWHRVLGVWLLPVTLVLTVSGLYFNWYGGFVAVVERVSPLTEPATHELSRLDAPVYAEGHRLDDAISAALATAPGPVDAVSAYPTLGVFNLRLFDVHDIDPFGRREITVDAHTFEVLGDHHPAAGTAGDVFIAWQYPLHSGRGLGWTGRLLVFAAGVGMCFICGSGLYLWLRRVFSKSRTRQRKA